MTRLILLVAGFGVGMFACAKLLPIEAGDRATIAAGWAVRILIGATVAMTAVAGYDVWNSAQIRLGDLTPEEDNASIIARILEDLFWKGAILLGLAAVVELAICRRSGSSETG